MPREINKVAVIGSGVMGAAIAAHVTNAGLPVVLLDIVGKDPNDRSAIAKGAVERLLKTYPAPFMSPRNARLITPGNLEDDLGLLADCDWIVEAIVENLKIKHSLYEKLETARKPGSIVTSNTSTIPLGHLVEGRSHAFRRDFAITHFFNPPRYLRLLELVSRQDTAPDVTETLARFCDVNLGKGVIRCHDTPGFIANRIGMMWDAGGRQRRPGSRAHRRRGGRSRRQGDGLPLNRRVRPVRPGRHRLDAASRRQHERHPAEERRLSRHDPRYPDHQSDDRDRVYRPQGQGRLLPDGQRGRHAPQGVDRPQDRRIRHAEAGQLR
jgi:3-hydroxyacyl-CoA dehydrogenase, NAD binding domain